MSYSLPHTMHINRILIPSSRQPLVQDIGCYHSKLTASNAVFLRAVNLENFSTHSGHVSAARASFSAPFRHGTPRRSLANLTYLLLGWSRLRPLSRLTPPRSTPNDGEGGAARAHLTHPRPDLDVTQALALQAMHMTTLTQQVHALQTAQAGLAAHFNARFEQMLAALSQHTASISGAPVAPPPPPPRR